MKDSDKLKKITDNMKRVIAFPTQDMPKLKNKSLFTLMNISTEIF